MIAPVSHLTGLPVEILEQVLLHLPGRDIIRIEAVCRPLQGVVRNSPTLQYKRKLFTSGLSDNPSVSCDLSQRIKTYEEYMHKWSDAGRVVKSVYKFPLEVFSDWHKIKHPGGNLLVVSRGLPDSRLAVVRVPSVVDRKPIEWWEVPPLPFVIQSYDTYPPDDVLAIAGKYGSSINVHLLNLLDGSPYCTPPSNVIKWAIPSPNRRMKYTEDVLITSSRLMLQVCDSRDGVPGPWWISVWDWKTGSPVFNLSYKDENVPPYDVKAIFLDELRMMIYTPKYTEDPPEFTLVDTFVPEQDRPTNFRRFRLPPEYRRSRPSVTFDASIWLGKPHQDEPLIVDPTQAFILLRPSTYDESADVVVVLRIQALVEQACLIGAGTHIPWRELERNAIIVELPAVYEDFFIQGVHLIHKTFDSNGGDDPPCLCIRTFDFSRRGCNALRDADGETVGPAWHEGGQEVILERSGIVPGDSFGPLGNGAFYHLAEDKLSTSVFELHVWELV